MFNRSKALPQNIITVIADTGEDELDIQSFLELSEHQKASSLIQEHAEIGARVYILLNGRKINSDV